MSEAIYILIDGFFYAGFIHLYKRFLFNTQIVTEA